MKKTSFIIIIIISFIVNLQAQTLEEADRLLTEKKYMEAALMYYQLYQFKKAADSYQMQINELGKNKKQNEADLIKPLLIHAEKAARMLSRCEDIQIIDSVIVNKNEFLSAYFVGEETGKFEQTNSTVIFENQLSDRRYFSKKDSYGLFRINSQIKIQDHWSDEKPLNLSIDDDADGNYPFVMPDGLTFIMHLQVTVRLEDTICLSAAII